MTTSMRPATGRSWASGTLTPNGLRGALIWVSIAALSGIAYAEPLSDIDVSAAAPGLEAFLVAPSQTTAAPPPPKRTVHKGIITRGRTLSALLRADGVSPQTIAEIARELKGHFDFRRARPGHHFRLVSDGDGQIVEFRYQLSATDAFTLTRREDGFQVSHDEIQLEPRRTRIAGVVATTLYQSIADLGEEGQLARDFADIFAWDIDFQRAVQPGDSFQILYERLYRQDPGQDVYVRPGRILAARYEGRAGSHTAVYFEPELGRGGYYRPNGSSVEGAFLMSPMRHGRITSHFSAARRHPILRVTRPHRGIDYAAATGTPVWSVADGEVIHRGWAGGSGNLVKIKHKNGYVSYYAHLSRFASTLRVGSRVKQKQVIGYVGQTGLATGPHVCFRVQQNGQYVNPARLRAPSGTPIPGTLVPAFRMHRDLLLAELDTGRRLAGRR